MNTDDYDVFRRASVPFIQSAPLPRSVVSGIPTQHLLIELSALFGGEMSLNIQKLTLPPHLSLFVSHLLSVPCVVAERMHFAVIKRHDRLDDYVCLLNPDVMK